MNNEVQQKQQTSAEAAGSMQRALNWVRDNDCAASVKAIYPGHQPTIEFRGTDSLKRILSKHKKEQVLTDGSYPCFGIRAEVDNILLTAIFTADDSII